MYRSVEDNIFLILMVMLIFGAMIGLTIENSRNSAANASCQALGYAYGDNLLWEGRSYCYPTITICELSVCPDLRNFDP